MSMKRNFAFIADHFLLYSRKIYPIRVSPCFITTRRSFHFAGNEKLKHFTILRSQHFSSQNYIQKSINDPQLTIKDVKQRLSEIMGVRKGFSEPPNRSNLLQYLPETQDELPFRSMKDSFVTALIPLSTDRILQDKYMTLMGNVRKGRLLEDMDIFAVWTCVKYINNPKMKADEFFPYSIVTAAVNQITFKGWPCKVTDDMRISGQVQWVGKTSLEICVWLESFISNEWKLFAKAYFIMVARNSTNTTGAFVNKLKPEGADEEETYAKAKERMERRHLGKKKSLLTSHPTEIEQRIIHEMYMKTIDLNDPTLNRRILPDNSVWIESTKVANMIFPHPEVVYTELNYAQILVHCELLDIMTNKMFTTNVFNYTYEYKGVLQNVVPQTYREAMMLLDGRRHFQKVMERVF
ncbi:acyl-coenzyme A thioesterase 9, mitochondrial-like isoform X2 [Rhodnius prolixus]|uniref:acyl-coenzyme A thioesterase 9, mitochondrial-like isoform X2 n=1 Tax=Rhodnius prolixus TaxID=13249 RepID=UPI003D18F507